MERDSAPAPIKRSSASVRYWKARLQVLKRPTVWVSALVLLLPLIFLANYWRNPEEFVSTQAANSTNPLAPSDGENTSNLVEGEATATSPAISDASTLLEVPALINPTGDGQTETRQTQTVPQPTLLDALLSTTLPGLDAKLPQSRTDLRSRNPFATQPRTVQSSNSESPQVQASNGTGSVLSSPLLSALSSTFLSPAVAQPAANLASGGSTQATVPLSPLQSALDRSAGIGNGVQSTETQSNSQSNSPSNLSAQALPNAGALPWLVPSTGQSVRPLGTQPLGTQTYIPQTSPFPGTTGYTLPSALRPAPSPYYSNAYSNSYYGAYPNSGYSSAPYSTGFPVGTVTPGYSTLPQLQVPIQTLPVTPYGRTPGYSGVPLPTFNPPAATVTPQPVPFSIPRTPPGRYIGGGEINTFSNP